MKFGTLMAATVLAVGMLTSTASAVGWKYTSYLYFWLPQMDGDLAVGDVATPVDLSLSDSADLINDTKGALMLHVEARKHPYTIMGDLFYLDLDITTPTPVGESSVEFTETIGEIAGTYALNTGKKNLTVEALGGGRYQQLDVGIDINSVGVNADGDQDWIDPFVGARAAYKASRKMVLSARGDIGGFGVGSDQAWNAVAAAQWALSKDWSLALAYRWLDVDYDHDGFVYNVLTDGPQVGLGYTW